MLLMFFFDMHNFQYIEWTHPKSLKDAKGIKQDIILKTLRRVHCLSSLTDIPQNYPL